MRPIESLTRHAHFAVVDEQPSFFEPRGIGNCRRPAQHYFCVCRVCMEIATKVRLGRLAKAETLERNFLAIMDRAGYTLIPIEAETALRAGRLPAPHGDPFDRVIAAQALAYDIPVLSADAKLDTFGIQRIW